MRKIPTALKAHLARGVTTTCRLLKLTLQDGRVFGMTTLDRDVEYNGVVYSAKQGFDPSIIATDASFGVDNAEAYSLFSVDHPGITPEMAERGEFDGAQFEMLLVNYKDLSQGHIVLDAGDMGEVRASNGAVFAPELLSYALRLRQAIGHVDSRTCRAKFGTLAGSQLGCGVDASGMWQTHTVTAVATDEPKVTFFASGIVGSSLSEPARVVWQSGSNVSLREYHVEDIDLASGRITLLEPLPFIVEAGDSFDIRNDCNKHFETCKTYGNAINFKGEPHIPTGQSSDTPN